MAFRKIKVSVAHGNIGYAEYPVAVGHYEGDIITSAESHLNRFLGNRLSLRKKLGLYPGALGSCEIILNPDQYTKPGGAVVMGLGTVGELTGANLASAFSQAALKYAMAVFESSSERFKSQEDNPKSAAITALLIGSGTAGIPIQDSVKAMLQGVQKANSMLSAKGLDQQVFIDAVEFMELWEDRAIHAARVVELILTDTEFDKCFDFSQRLIRQAPGGRTRVTFDEAPHWWRRLRVFGDTGGALHFSMMTDRARTEVSLLPMQRILVDQLIDQAIRYTGNKEDVGRTLFELLIPNYLKERVRNRQNLVLILNEESARYPWELLQDQTSENRQPLAVEMGVLRQLETTVFRESMNTIPRKSALVIGTPQCSLVPLLAAKEEAQMVRGKLLSHGYKVETRIDANALEITQALYADTYRILHLTGHGVYEAELPDKQGKVSGMVIGDSIWLTPKEVEQMRSIPEIVFINCCYLGRIEDETDIGRNDYHKLAANLATQFIRIGVRVVIAAGWAVEDEAAQTFSTQFYDKLLSGASLGQAVLSARRKTYNKYSGFNTWGAYQCYGDPSFTLSQSTPSITETQRNLCFHAPSETIAEIGNLANDAKTATLESTKDLVACLNKCVEQLPAGWLRLGDVCAVLGRAYGELGHFHEAISYFQMAMDAEKSNFSLQSIEQMANFQSRWAIKCWKESRQEIGVESDSAKDIDFLQKLDQAIALLNKLCEFGVTGERLSLLGSAYKRKAWVTTGQERKEALIKMSENYMRAYELRRDKADMIDPYPLLNWLTGKLVLGWFEQSQTEHSKKELLEQLLQVEISVRASEEPKTDFWSSITLVECALIRYLTQTDLALYTDEIVQGYKAAQLRGASSREFRSVLENQEFLIEMLQSEAVSIACRQQLEHSLKLIFTQLSTLSDH